MFILFCQAYGSKNDLIAEFGDLAGYRKAMDLMQFGFIFLSIGLVVIFAPIFAEDNANGVKYIISSTEKGKENDYLARVNAAFTITIISFIIMIGIIIGVCGFIYGYQGAEMKVNILYPSTIEAAPELASKSIVFYFMRYLLISLSAVLMLTALLIWISSFSKTIVHAFLGSLFVYFVPIVLENIFQRGSMNPEYVFVTGQPVLLVVNRCLEES